MLPSQSTMRPSLASFGFFTLFCSSIIYFSPPSFGQLDKQYIQQQNNENQYKQWCHSLRQSAKRWFKKLGEYYFIAKIGGQSTLLDNHCGWRRVLGKTYNISGMLEMFKLEDNSVFVYTKFRSSTRIIRTEAYTPAPSLPTTPPSKEMGKSIPSDENRN